MAANTPTKKGGAWDDAEKYQFLLKIISQVGGGSGGGLTNIHPKFSEIDLNGRTAKAMTLMWGKIKQEAFAGASNGTGNGAPASTPRKRKANGNAAGTPTPKKRTPARKKTKKEDSDDEEEEMPELDDESEEEVVRKPKFSAASDEEDEDEFFNPKRGADEE